MQACETLETNIEHRTANLKNLTDLASVSGTCWRLSVTASISSMHCKSIAHSSHKDQFSRSLPLSTSKYAYACWLLRADSLNNDQPPSISL